MSIQVTGDQIRAMVRLRFSGGGVIPRDSIVDGLARAWETVMGPAGIGDNPRRVSHFLAQAAHETAHFKTLVEYADGVAYEGRHDLGNTEPGDGPRYKGRGIFQLTGRANYRDIGRRIGVDLEADPGRAAEPEISLKTAAAYWTARGINPLADGDHPEDVQNVTRAINGGLNGFDDRLAYYRAARRIWKDGASADEAAIPGLGAEAWKAINEAARIPGACLTLTIPLNGD